MDNRKLIFAFFSCGDDQIIQFAIQRAHLNRLEAEVLDNIVEKICSQEECAAIMGYSTRTIQNIWKSLCDKLLSIDWVRAYATELSTRH